MTLRRSLLVLGLAAALCAPPARAAGVSSGTLRLALVEDAPSDVWLSLAQPLERALKRAGAQAKLLDAATLPGYTSGPDYRFRLRDRPGDAAERAAVLETHYDAALIFPPLPGLVEALRQAAADPASYGALPWSAQPSLRSVALQHALGPDGESLVTALQDPARGEPARWQPTVAALYRVLWDGAEARVAVVGRVHAGLARLSTALARERAKGPLVGVARHHAFGGYFSELEGRALAETLESLGLDYSAVSNSELRRYDEFSAYLAERPDGIRFLSANLVYSSAPATAVYPRRELLRAGGLRVALVGITDPSAAKYLAPAGLRHLTILDPVQAFEALAPSLRAEADAVVVLAGQDSLQALRSRARGADLILAEDWPGPDQSPRFEAQGDARGRQPFDPPLWTARAFQATLTLLEAEASVKDGLSDWRVRERHVPLDEGMPRAFGLPEFEPEAYGIAFTTETPLIPSVRSLYPDGPPGGGFPRLSSRGFWTLASSLLAEETGSEAALLRVIPQSVQLDGEVPEGVVKAWLRYDEPAVVLHLQGSALRRLLRESSAQASDEAWGQGDPGKPRFTAGGPAADESAVEDRQVYRVVASRTLTEALSLQGARGPRPLGRTVGQAVLDALKKRAGSPPEDYRAWIDGRPARVPGLWRINFREVGLRLQNTKVVRDDAFDGVPNSRIQGFDELLIGGAFKADADYLRGPFKWANTVELEYARSRLKPRHQPPVTNTAADRCTVLTAGTRRAGSIEREWLARHWGPTLGVQYDGQFEPPGPGLRRKQIYSAFPGVEFYGGSLVRSLSLGGNVKRDLSRVPPNTQYGLNARGALSKRFGPGKALRVEGEAFANYFFLTKRDTPQDLRAEGKAALRLHVPIRGHLTIAPFLDLYAFALKTRPLWGYSAMTGVSIGFSRLWKPQYEPF